MRPGFTLAFLLFIFLGTSSYAQNVSSKKGYGSMGVGVGLPYGGVGIQFNKHFINYVSAFGGIGYNLMTIGLNAGLNFTVPTEKKTELYFTGMYGYNGVIKYKNDPNFNKTYYGVSLGSGIKINSQKHHGRYWNIGALAPIRSSIHKSRLEGITSKNNMKAWPILLNFGYHYNLK